MSSVCFRKLNYRVNDLHIVPDSEDSLILERGLGFVWRVGRYPTGDM